MKYILVILLMIVVIGCTVIINDKYVDSDLEKEVKFLKTEIDRLDNTNKLNLEVWESQQKFNENIEKQLQYAYNISNGLIKIHNSERIR